MMLRPFLLFLCLVLSTGVARAHELNPAIATLSFDQGTTDIPYTLTLELNLEAVIADIAADHDNTEDAPNAAEYDALRQLNPEDLQTAYRQAGTDLAGAISVTVEGEQTDLTLDMFDIPAVGDTDLARISTVTLQGSAPAGAERATVQMDDSIGDVILRVDAVDGSDSFAEFVLAGQQTQAFLITTVTPRSQWDVAQYYTVVGFEHVLPLGLDHILFVLGLFLLSARLGPLLWQVSAFTLAHTVTLALTTLGYITLSGAIVEPIIAASIVFIAVENIFAKGLTPWRPVIVFAFGLLHGIGFAGALSEFGLSQEYFLTSLIAFNIGVELAQITVIMAGMLLVGFWFRNRSWYRTVITIPGSVIIVLIGAYWVVERTLL